MQLALRREAKRRHGLLVRATAFSHGLHSKAIASTFQFKAGFADNKHARALQHHGYGGFGGGAHYTMAGSKQFQKGVRIKGVISRHSKQGARMQAGARDQSAKSRREQHGRQAMTPLAPAVRRARACPRAPLKCAAGGARSGGLACVSCLFL